MRFCLGDVKFALDFESSVGFGWLEKPGQDIDCEEKERRKTVLSNREHGTG